MNVIYVAGQTFRMENIVRRGVLDVAAAGRWADCRCRCTTRIESTLWLQDFNCHILHIMFCISIVLCLLTLYKSVVLNCNRQIKYCVLAAGSVRTTHTHTLTNTPSMHRWKRNLCMNVLAIVIAHSILLPRPGCDRLHILNFAFWNCVACGVASCKGKFADSNEITVRATTMTTMAMATIATTATTGKSDEKWNETLDAFVQYLTS